MNYPLHLNRFFSTAIAAGFLLIPAKPVLAVSFDYDGYYRTRGSLYHQLDLNSDTFNANRFYVDQRFRLNPTLTVTDFIAIKGSLFMLDNTFFGDTSGVAGVANNPSFYQSDASNPTGTPVLYQDPTLNALALNSTLSPGLISVQRLYAEIQTPVGVVLVGRQPSHFGLGIYENSGDGPFDDFGDSYDRLSFQTGFSNYILHLGYDFITETDNSVLAVSREQSNGIDNGVDDIQRFFVRTGVDTDARKLMVQLSRRWQGASDFTAWIIDTYGTFTKDWFRLSGEFLTVQGSYQTKDISVYNYALRAEAVRPDWNIGLENGLASGTGGGPLNATEMNSLPFNRDYNISTLLFEEALPGGAAVDTTNASNDVVASTTPHSGAVSNAIYGRFFLNYTFFNRLTPSLNILTAFSHTGALIGFDPNQAGALSFSSHKWYGIEYDLDLTLKINDHLQCALGWAHLLPGGIFGDQQRLSGATGADSTFAAIAKLLVQF